MPATKKFCNATLLKKIKTASTEEMRSYNKD